MKAMATWIAKGGVGKSTLCGNFGFYLKERGKVLLVDADPQGNLSGWLHPDPFKYELADVLEEKAGIREAALNIRPQLDLIPTFAIDGHLKRWSETSLPSRPFTFHDLRDKVASAGYDYLVFDMSPGTSILERSIIATMDEVMPIVRPEYFSFDGLEVFEATMTNIRKELRARTTAQRLIVNGINMSFQVHQSYYEALKNLSYELFTVGQTTRATEAQTAHQFLAEYDPKNKVLAEYKRLAEAV